jgi:hypothetical protein
MSSSKEAEPQASEAVEPRQANSGRWAIKSLVGAVVIALCAGGLYLAFRNVPQDDAPPFVPVEEVDQRLVDARKRLKAIPESDSPEARLEHAEQAEKLLSDYLSDKPSDATAQVLLAVAKLGQGKQANDLLEGADLTSVPSDDLTTAALLALGARQPGEADRLITAALEKAVDRDYDPLRAGPR